MDCRHIQDLLPDYSVEILDARTHRQVESHLTACEECRAELRAMDSVMELVEEHGLRQPPPGLFNAVRNRIESGEIERERPAWWAWFNTRPARTAAMGLAMAAVVVGLMAPLGPSTDPGVPALPMHVSNGSPVTSNALASSIRQHAMSAVDGPLADRVAWEAMAQLVSMDQERPERRENPRN